MSTSLLRVFIVIFHVHFSCFLYQEFPVFSKISKMLQKLMDWKRNDLHLIQFMVFKAAIPDFFQDQPIFSPLSTSISTIIATVASLDV